jgi:hypothetical protein
MTDNLKVWVENGKIAVQVTLPNGEKLDVQLKKGPLYCTENTVVVCDPNWGNWVFTNGGIVFSAPPSIESVFEYKNELIIWADGWKFVFDIQTGQIKSMRQE